MLKGFEDLLRMMAVTIQTEPELTIGMPQMLFEDPTLIWDYDVDLDGRHFFMLRQEQPAAPAQINVVLDWGEELKRLAPTSH